MAKKVLIVDDSTTILEMLRLMIGAAGYEVLTAADPDRGVGLAERELPHLIIMDLMMPGESGYTTCQRLKASRQTDHIPILVLTANGDRQAKEKSLQAGAAAFLLKPCPANVLIQCIRQLAGDP